MIKKVILMTIVLAISACANERPVLKGVDGNDIPAAFAHFPDMPFPEPAYVDLNQTKALGSGEKWIGSLVYDTPYNASSIFDFYTSEMPKLKWVEVATVRAKISHMTYIRDNRAVQILIQSDGNDKSFVTLTAIPNQSNLSY